VSTAASSDVAGGVTRRGSIVRNVRTFMDYLLKAQETASRRIERTGDVSKFTPVVYRSVIRV
jgi:hypothetical protein